MKFTLISLSLFIAAVHAGLSTLSYSLPATSIIAPSYAQPLYARTLVAAVPVLHKTVVRDDYHSNPQYTFSYDVQDSTTGDSKNQHETRNGNVVKGQYSLNDADGTRRVVDYSADSIHGFNAVVRKEALVNRAVIVAQPVYTKIQ